MDVQAIHPGDHLAEELRELDMGAAVLARQIDTPASRVTEIFSGRRAVNGDADFQMKLQEVYETSTCRGERRRGHPPTADTTASRGRSLIDV